MSVKLLLIEDVEDLGKSGDIVTAKPGYARNYLFPRRLAIPADKRALLMQEKLQEERKKKAVVEKKEAEEIAKVLEGITLTIVVKVDAEGRMFGSVSALDVKKKLEEEHKLDLGKKAIQLPHPIKKTGVHTIAVKLKEEVESSIQLKVVPEEEHKKEETAESE